MEETKQITDIFKLQMCLVPSNSHIRLEQNILLSTYLYGLLEHEIISYVAIKVGNKILEEIKQIAQNVSSKPNLFNLL